MTERQQLEQAIAALEGQRALLGEAVVETALAPLREKLARLSAAETAAPATTRATQRKLVTVLFADVSGFTALSETLDAEEVRDRMNALWARLDAVIRAQGGVIDKHIGDAVMAIWGEPAAREDDAERAIRAALAMQAELRAEQAMPMRIGINTGLVVLGEVGTTGEFTAMGDTVNLASRLEHAAPVGGLLISHDTYRQVRGIFDVRPLEPIQVKGKAERVRVYVVERAKPRAFRMATRGVEGVETRLIGRATELGQLQQAWRAVLAQRQTRLVTVVGEAGLGKSRLLYEFQNWLELQPEAVWYFKGRATPAMSHLPYGLLRDLFEHRFEILENDSAVEARAKLEQGVAAFLGGAEGKPAHFIGHLLGFDFSASPYLAGGVLNDARQFREQALAYLTDFFSAAAQAPTLIFLEDIHWADEGTLDWVTHFRQARPQVAGLFLCLTRPTLFERQPQWGQDPASERLALRPLSAHDSRQLVDEILSHAPALPERLYEVILNGAEGNPYYVEELLKMWIEQGLIFKDAQARWQVDTRRLALVQVPPALTGILQARLDALPPAERLLLQRASVVGRIFWEDAVVFLKAAEQPDAPASAEAIQRGLAAVQDRELIFRREETTLAGMREYIFKHAMLHEVTYESVLKRWRRVYHAQAAVWLAAQAGDRLDEYAGLIADHYERAGLPEQAVDYLERTGRQALKVSALREARVFFERALALLPEVQSEPSGELARRTRLLRQIGEVDFDLGDYPTARNNLEESLALAQTSTAVDAIIEARQWLGDVFWASGDYRAARAQLEESLRLAEALGHRRYAARSLRGLGTVDWSEGDYAKARERFEASLTICRALNDTWGMARALNNVGTAILTSGGQADARVYYEEGLALARQSGDQRTTSNCLNNLGLVAEYLKQFEVAQHYYRESLALDQHRGDRAGIAITLSNLGDVARQLGDDAEAWRCFRESLSLNMTTGAIPSALFVLSSMAQLVAKAGQPERALDVLSVVLQHPAHKTETTDQLTTVVQSLQAALPAEKVAAALERGAARSLEAVVADMLAEAERFVIPR